MRTGPTIHLIAHTHWDREWYLPLGRFTARLVVLLDDLLSRLEADPGYPPFLLDGQTVLLNDYLAVRPDQRERVTRLVRAGRLLTGPWYVLADEQIPGGESLLRNLLLGAADARALGGGSPVLYSPDAFGHPAVLPAVGAEFGLAQVVLWRGLHPDVLDGGDLAWWEAPDGRRVLVYQLPADGYEVGASLLVPDDRLAEAWQAVRGRLAPRAATRQIALPVGADHHAADPALAALAGRLARVDDSMTFRWSTYPGFFAAVRGEQAALPLIRGELRDSYGYTWTLQGTHATRAPLKRRHAGIELALTRRAEPLAALARLAGVDQRAVLEAAWRALVECQFHDTLCGTVADAVAQAMAVRLEYAEGLGAESARAALFAVAGHDPDAGRSEPAAQRPTLLLWNPAARRRRAVAVAELTFFKRDVPVGPPGERKPRTGPGYRRMHLRSADGVVVPLQVLSRARALERLDAPRHYPDLDEVDRVRVAFEAPEMSGLGLAGLTPVPGVGPRPTGAVRVLGRSLGNERIELTLERAGSLVLGDHASGARYAGLAQVESERDRGDCYTFCPESGDTLRQPSRAVRPEVVASGPLFGALAWETAFACGGGERSGAGRVRVKAEAELVSGSSLVRLRLTVDNQARDHRLRLRFPTGLLGTGVLAGAQFGVVSRPRAGTPGRQGDAAPGESPVSTAPAHRFVAVATGARGLAVFAPGFFEYEWTGTGDLLITLLRSVGELSRADLSARPGHAGWPTPTPLAQCPGVDVIELAIAPVIGEDLARPERLEALWEDAFLPLEANWQRDYTGSRAPLDLPVELTGPGLVVSGILPDLDGCLLLRCYNVGEETVSGSWRLGAAVAGAHRVRADGTFLEQLATAEGGVVRFTAAPRGLVSVRVQLAPGR